MDWQAVRLSFLLASWTTFILVLVGVPFSYWFSNTQLRLKFLVDALIALPLVLPPTVLGYYVLSVLGPRSPLGYLYEKWTGGILPFTFQGLLIGSLLYSCPFAVQPFISAFSRVNRKCVEASWCLGASKMDTFVHIILPMCYPGILTGIILSFAHTLGEFGMVLMIGGNIPGITRTISVSIYDDVQSLNPVAAGQSALFLLGIAFVALALTSWLRPKNIQTQ
jgi:molybdate transport system permease protein